MFTKKYNRLMHIFLFSVLSLVTNCHFYYENGKDAELAVLNQLRIFTASNGTTATPITTTTPLALTYTGSPYSFFVNEGMTTITPTTTGTITNCTASPSLPTGLSISSSTCAISETPTVTGFGASYTINMTAPNGAASTSFILKIMGTTALRVYGQLGSFTSGTANNGGIAHFI